MDVFRVTKTSSLAFAKFRRWGTLLPDGLARAGVVAGGPEGTLEELEEFLRANGPQLREKQDGKRPKSRSS
jgi:hypothetical protein